MAIKLITTLTSTAGEGFITKADQIACEVEQVTGGLIPERVTKNLAQKLQEIVASISNINATGIKYTPTGGNETTLAEYLNNLTPEISFEGTAADIIYEDTKTIKQKIKEIEDLISNEELTAEEIKYSYVVENEGETTTTEVTLKTFLDSLREAFGGSINISEQVQQCNTYATQARNSAQSAQIAQTAINSSIKENSEQITNITNDVKNKIAGVESKIDGLDNIAKQLSTVLETDAQFRILSKSQYDSLETYDDNVVYFCYDDPKPTVIEHTITLNCNSEQGTVVGQGTYNEGTEITIVALPKRNFYFTSWSDENTDNPRTIVVNESKVLSATFEPIV